jgi:hypothetical protein
VEISRGTDGRAREGETGMKGRGDEMMDGGGGGVYKCWIGRRELGGELGLIDIARCHTLVVQNRVYMYSSYE